MITIQFGQQQIGTMPISDDSARCSELDMEKAHVLAEKIKETHRANLGEGEKSGIAYTLLLDNPQNRMEPFLKLGHVSVLRRVISSVVGEEIDDILVVPYLPPADPSWSREQSIAVAQMELAVTACRQARTKNVTISVPHHSAILEHMAPTFRQIYADLDKRLNQSADQQSPTYFYTPKDMTSRISLVGGDLIKARSGLLINAFSPADQELADTHDIEVLFKHYRE